MRALMGWILVLGLCASPVLARAGSSEDSNSAVAVNSGKTAVANANVAAAADPAAANAPAAPAGAPAAAPAAQPSSPAPAPQPSPAPAPKAAAPDPQGGAASPLSFNIGIARFTPGGFMDLTNYFRTTTDGTSSIGSNFGTTAYNTVLPGSKLTQDHFSLQNSRLSLRIDSNVAGGTAVGYVETDFLGNSASSIFVTSNSDTLRLRLYFLDYRRGNWEILAGQDWSMLTANRTGIGFMPGDIFYSQDMDTNYQAGLVWERTAQFRFLYHPNKVATLGLSIENPQQYLGGSAAVSSSATTELTGSAIILPAGFSTGQVDINGSSSNINSVAPDLVGKIAFDPMVNGRDFHFEVAGVERDFRVNTILSTGQSINDTAVGGGGEFNMNLELFKNFHFIENAYWSDGGGREIGNSLVPDFIVRPQASSTSAYTISPVHAGSGILGFEWQANPMHMIYGYYSTVYVGQNLAAGTAAQCGPLLLCGYGAPGVAETTAELSNRNIQEATLGYIPKFWTNPNYGTVQLITQFSYVLRDPWYVAAGNPRMAHLFLSYIDLRYVLP